MLDLCCLCRPTAYVRSSAVLMNVLMWLSCVFCRIDIFSLNSLSVRVLYNFSSLVSGYRGARSVARSFLEHFVYKTNGCLMIFNFFYSMASVKIIFCVKTAKYTVKPMVFLLFCCGPPSHGPPIHGPPIHGPPSHGPPRHGPPSHGPTIHGPPSHGPPSHGPPSHGPPIFGPPSHGPPSHGPPSHGPPIFGPL